MGDSRLQNLSNEKKKTLHKHRNNIDYRRLGKLKMTDLLAAAVKNNLGLHLLHWAVSRSDVWHLAHRCAELIHKIDEPLEKSALDHLLTLDEDEIDCYGIRRLQMHNLHFEEEDEDNDYSQQQEQMNSDRGRNAINRNNHANELELAGKLEILLFVFNFILFLCYCV